MDTPTYIVLVALVTSLGIALFLRYSRMPRVSAYGLLFLSTALIWVLIVLCGEFFYTWAGNATCSKYLGCVQGFLGYDAYEHLLFGIAAALALIWISMRYPKYSILHTEWWKTALTVIAVIALISVIWEMMECAHDALRLDIFHEPLRNIRLHVNLLDQPSNIDTMGDLTFGLLGAIVGVFLLKRRD